MRISQYQDEFSRPIPTERHFVNGSSYIYILQGVRVHYERPRRFFADRDRTRCVRLFMFRENIRDLRLGIRESNISHRCKNMFSRSREMRNFFVSKQTRFILSCRSSIGKSFFNDPFDFQLLYNHNTSIRFVDYTEIKNHLSFPKRWPHLPADVWPMRVEQFISKRHSPINRHEHTSDVDGDERFEISKGGNKTTIKTTLERSFGPNY